MIFVNRWSKPAYWFNIYSWRKTLLMSRLLKPCPLTSQSVQEPMALNLFITSIHNIPYVYVCKRMQPIWLKYIHCYLVYYIVHSWIAQIKFYMFSMIFQSPFWFLLTIRHHLSSLCRDDVIKWKHLCGEFTGHRWIPRTKASDAELWCFLWSAPGWTVE